MGMDVHGNKPTTEAGGYFRRSVWGWHPLWQVCELLARPITEKVKYAHSNDGDGLDATDSKRLAKRLKQALLSGEAKKVIELRDHTLANLPLKDCHCCAGTGKRPPPPAVGPGTEHCIGCDGKGKVKDEETWYTVDVHDIREFSTFLDGCGGFEIW